MYASVTLLRLLSTLRLHTANVTYSNNTDKFKFLFPILEEMVYCNSLDSLARGTHRSRKWRDGTSAP